MRSRCDGCHTSVWSLLSSLFITVLQNQFSRRSLAGGPPFSLLIRKGIITFRKGTLLPRKPHVRGQLPSFSGPKCTFVSGPFAISFDISLTNIKIFEPSRVRRGTFLRPLFLFFPSFFFFLFLSFFSFLFLTFVGGSRHHRGGYQLVISWLPFCFQ